MKLYYYIKPTALKRFVFLAAGFFIFWGATTMAAAGDKAGTTPVAPTVLPFFVGEEISYRVSWEMIPAGDVTLKVLEHTTIGGQRARHFVLTARSKRFIDYFYKIRDRYESYTDLAFTRSLLYKKMQSGKEDKQVEVVFDWEKRTAAYSNHGGKRPAIDIPDHTFDPLASFYKLRCLDLSRMDVHQAASQTTGISQSDLFFPVTDGKKHFIQQGKILKKEQITLGRKTYDTYVVIPQVNHFSGVFEKSKDATVKVWLSADKRQIPVKIAIKVFIGSIIFELIDDSSV